MKNLWLKTVSLVTLGVGILSIPAQAQLMDIRAFVKGMD